MSGSSLRTHKKMKDGAHEGAGSADPKLQDSMAQGNNTISKESQRGPNTDSRNQRPQMRSMTLCNKHLQEKIYG